ncbi:exonuclease domain-containing protein [Corynebacterium aquatimens]|uniref:DNA polymerase-3 subunit epsilon n=1 Tax=Corynebacterium aquatimens TaxID=1190508 RepID=A0A931GRG4_9CORY|nr:exonuclease domain-containing protein [Corynebacterium aquatimens]MBG6121933.1 DNA polymerase-3 subunit epsilon [Corynebacterium aquatimens]
MIKTHGAHVAVTTTAVEIHPDPLAAALCGVVGTDAIDITTIGDVTVHEGDAWDGGAVSLTLAPSGDKKGGDPDAVVIRFAPGDTDGPSHLAGLIRAAISGDAEALSNDPAAAAALPGFDFVALDVETANQNWGSVCQIGLAKVTDGEITETASWLCQPPEPIAQFDDANVTIHGIAPEKVAGEPTVAKRLEELAAFVGDLPVVAHNAYFDASALRTAAIYSNVPAPRFSFGCTLAQSRATDLGVANHRLPTVCDAVGVTLDNHHDAADDARACAELMVALARRAKHTGTLIEFIHATGFALGSIGDDRVTPSLLDRSGATIALQARAAQTQATGWAGALPATDVDDASENPAEASHTPTSNTGAGAGAGAGEKKSRRGPAPWQAVATPDTIPEPSPDANPNSPLFGHNVTLTGEFEPYDKGTLWDGIAAQGGKIGKNVTKKTTVLVVGEWGSMTSKEKRARELIDKGQEIQIWTAQQLIDVLDLPA